MSHDRKKLAIKIDNKAVTTAVVVDCPTPLAPPVVVIPQLQPIMATSPPKTIDLITAVHKSQTFRKFCIESIKTSVAISNKLLAIINPPNIPTIKDKKVRIGSIKQQAITRGTTK